MTATHLSFTLDDDPARLDLDRITTWLASSYWTPGIGREWVDRAIANTAVLVGAYTETGTLAAFARVVSDKTRFAYLCDVWVDEPHRAQGLGRAMVRFLLEHPELRPVSRWTLATADAQGVYAELGFAHSDRPERWMEIIRQRDWSLPLPGVPQPSA